jgi:hypothetical protein
MQKYAFHLQDRTIGIVLDFLDPSALTLNVGEIHASLRPGQ